MFYKTNGFKLCVALLVGVVVFLLPRPEGTQFKITGDTAQILMQNVKEHFVVFPDEKTESFTWKKMGICLFGIDRLRRAYPGKKTFPDRTPCS